ncbi:hypothetical protein BDU57DRAFT_565983 [Ampelomyces quisqualis]|uniref:Uncharacterized protein n=1 Tax=Ampelomyces quisqualis TaxID=50730 RepID=A0A6A5Q759_AMPQU|nr:hypothetical protein BDU57DRAFT_565983 [Ampelomyces quisqualis]
MNADGDMETSTTSRNSTSFSYTYLKLMSNPSNETFTSSLNKLYKPQTQSLNDTNTTMLLPGDYSSKYQHHDPSNRLTMRGKYASQHHNPLLDPGTRRQTQRRPKKKTGGLTQT